MSTTVQEFRTAYIQTLNELRESDPQYNPTGKSAEEIVDKMIEAVRVGGRNDWLTYNPAMKKACLLVGIKKSAELRTLIKGQ